MERRAVDLRRNAPRADGTAVQDHPPRRCVVTSRCCEQDTAKINLECHPDYFERLCIGGKRNKSVVLCC